MSAWVGRWAPTTAAPSSILGPPDGRAGAGAGRGHSIPGRLLTASVLTQGCSQGLRPSQTGQTKSTFMNGH